MAKELEWSAKVLWDAAAQQVVIRRHVRRIVWTSIFQMLMLWLAGVDVIMHGHGLTMSLCIALMWSVVSIASIGYSAAQIRMVGDGLLPEP